MRRTRPSLGLIEPATSRSCSWSWTGSSRRRPRLGQFRGDQFESSRESRVRLRSSYGRRWLVTAQAHHIQLLAGGDAHRRRLHRSDSGTAVILWFDRPHAQGPIDDGFYEGDELIVCPRRAVNAVLGATATHTVASPTTRYSHHRLRRGRIEPMRAGAISVVITPPSAFPIDLEISAVQTRSPE